MRVKDCSSHSIPKTLVITAICLAAGIGSTRAAEWALPPDHPRLLLRAADLSSLQARCGVGRDQSAPASAASDFGVYRDDLARLKAVTADIMQAHARADDLTAPALLHLILGRRDQPDEYTQYISKELEQFTRPRLELDGLIALDWCWDALEPTTRAAVVQRFLGNPEPLEIVHSPLDHLTFIKLLESLASAIVLADSDCGPWPALAGRMQLVRAAASDYFGGPFPLFCRQRGAMPTSPTAGIWEEADIALACELWRCASGQNLLSELRESAGRLLDHYFYADTESPALNHGFIHDDGSTIPLRPSQTWRGFVPAVPFVLAKHARSPIAAWYASRMLPAGGGLSPESDRYLWARFVYSPWDIREAPRRVMPLARSFGGGWVAMRSGWSPGETVLLFDGGQPFWRSRQHFDAGQFQIYRKGRLAIDSGDDVEFQAASDQGGQTLINGLSGDWDSYAQATIAHNDITVVDQKVPQQLYGRDWLAMGNQRLIERDYSPAEGDITKTQRHTGELIAFETNLFYSYAAADLTPAYPRRIVQSLSRRILFLHAGVVLVLDRVQTVQPPSLKTWHLQLPVRPTVLASIATRPSSESSATSTASGVPESSGSSSTPRSGHTAEDGAVQGSNASSIDARELHGATTEAGIWELSDDRSWLSVTSGEGRLFVRTLMPENAHRRLVGGPMRARVIKDGPSAGKTYYGGDPGGYEYRLWPAHFLKGPSAAYELGKPLGLGPQFGVGGAWGRYDVSPGVDGNVVTFLHVLAPTDAAAPSPPMVRYESSAQAAHISLTLGDQAITIDLSLTDNRGKVNIRNPLTDSVLLDKELEMVVKP